MADSLNSKSNQLNGDALKLIAAISMVIDHIGAILLPQIAVLRVIGRIAFPVFAFFIAEGCYYTKNRCRYFLNLLFFAAVTQGIKVIFNDNDDLNILFTFAIAVIVIFAFQILMSAAETKKEKQTMYMSLVFAMLIAMVWMLNRVVVIQYSFWGCLAPFIIYLAHFIQNSSYTKPQLKLILLFVALTAVYFTYSGVQIWAYAAILLLVQYSGKKGDRLPKYFFYIFYPSHLAILYLIKTVI